MGLGMIVCVPRDGVGKALEILASIGERAFDVGVVEAGPKGVVYD